MTHVEVRSQEALSARQARDAVARDGYFRGPSAVSAEEFRAVAESFGEVFYEAEVRMGAERPRNYQLPAAIDFHTDHVSAEFAAWCCLERESDGGAMQFLDLAPVASALSDDELEALSRVRVPDNAVWSQGGDIALCRRTERGWSFHYVPWLDLGVPDEEARAALARFEQGIAAAKSSALIEFDLAPGEVVFIDNHRVMHGRAAIPPGSRRHLKRLWIRSATGGGQVP